MASRSRAFGPLLIAGSACVAAVLATAPRGAAQGQAGAQQNGTERKRMVVTPFEAAQARFAPLNPQQPDGPQISVLWGDYKTGPSTALFRFPRNYGGRFHTHSADYHLSLLQGTMKHWGEGQREADAPPLTAGAYWYQPGGQVHSDNCLSDFCVAFVKFEGPIDVDYIDSPPARVGLGRRPPYSHSIVPGGLEVMS